MEKEIEETEANDPPVRLYTEAYKDSFFFDELSSIEPMDWVNIPKPIQLVVNSIKKCLTSNNKQLSGITEKLNQITSRFKKKLENFEEKIEKFGTTLNDSIENTSHTLTEFKMNLNDEVEAFKDKFSKDINFKVKNLEGKAAYVEDQVLNVKKIVGSLPTGEDIDKKIVAKNQEFKEIVKVEMNNYYLQPAVALINEEIAQVKCENEKSRESFEGFKLESLGKMKEFESLTNESFKKVEGAIRKVKNKLVSDMKQSESVFEKQLETQSRYMESLSSSFHELNHKYFSEIVMLQKEMESQKNKTSDFLKNFDSLKKAFDEKVADEEKALLESPSELGFASQESAPRIPENKSITEIPTVPIQTFQVIEKPLKKPVKKTVKQVKQAPAEDYSKKISSLQKYVDQKFELFESKLNKEINETIIPLEKRMKEVILRNESDFVEIKEKLAWLPISFSQIKGKSPNEARIFTLEARLRAEENTRHEAINKILQMMDSFQANSPPLNEESYLPPLRTNSVVHERNYSQDSGLGNESVRRQAESELARFSNMNNAFKPGKSHFLKKFSLKNNMNSTMRENSFFSRK